MELILIRHGLPLREERKGGRLADPPLSEEGRRQAEGLARFLAPEPIDAVYTSPLRRAAETARPLAAGRRLEPVVEAGVVEVAHLRSVYEPLEERKARDPEGWLALARGGGDYAGVDLGAFRRRVAEVLERIIAAHSGGRVAIVSHGGVINAWASEVLALGECFFFEPAYASVSRFLAASTGERSVRSLNETGHLHGA